jgi:hypothetical protein
MQLIEEEVLELRNFPCANPIEEVDSKENTIDSNKNLNTEESLYPY